MSALPTHKATQQSRFGIFLKEVSSHSPETEVKYAHQDDYHLFGIVTQGECRVSIDFGQYRLSAYEAICIHPGQIHQILGKSDDAAASLLFVDSAFVEKRDKEIFARYALAPFPLELSIPLHSEIQQLLQIISLRIHEAENDRSKSIIQNLTRALTGIFSQAIQQVISQHPQNNRHIEIVLALKGLLDGEAHPNRRPSHYAQQLHISPVYLNEVVKSITRLTASQYIQHETITRAKRRLLYTPQSIKEIAFDLGFDDYAYFTRLFNKVTGESPSSFRERYLE